jgi:hypothetical protein
MAGSGHTEVVRVATLDSFDLHGVGLIKIDVEGAELGVLEGAVETLRRFRPLLLVEIEQRHHRAPIGGVFERLRALDYDGHFLDGRGVVRPIEEFDVERHQVATLDNPARGPYINNFLFQSLSGGDSGRWSG